MYYFIYDFDNTIINIDSDNEWNLLLCRIKLKNLYFFLKNINFLINYNYSNINIFKYVYFSLKIFKFYKFCKINNLLIIFKNYINKNYIFIKKNEIIKLNNIILISSSTNIILIKNLINKIKVNLSNNTNIYKLIYNYNINYNNKIIGIVNYKKNKILNKKIIFFNKNKKNLIFYSDSVNDLFFLKKNYKYHIKNPDKILFNLSITKKFTINFLKINFY